MPAAALRNRYSWNDTYKRWRDRASGRFVPERAVGTLRDRYVLRTAGRLNDHTARRAAGTLTTAQWRDAMKRELKNAHLTATATAWGGWEHVPPEAWLRAGRRLNREFRHLDRMARLLEGKRVTAQAKKFQARARSYVANTRIAYEAEKDVAARHSRVALEERWLYGGAEDHCGGCSKQRAKKWVPNGTLPAIGSQDCLWFCKCRKIRRVAAPGA